MKAISTNYIERSLLRSALLFVSLLLGCFAIPPAQAVSPPPVGGYAGGNTAGGQNALLSLTTGTYNTALGLFSLMSDTTGKFNTGVGAGTLQANTADQNTAIGAGALLSNTTGFDNTANGTFALLSNTTGISNTANGFSALLKNTTGGSNTATGVGALSNNTTANGNTATGGDALFSNTTGDANTATGFGALAFNSTGDLNTATGNEALFHNTTGVNNTAIGVAAGANQNTGSNNVYIGAGMEGVAGESNACYIASIFNQTSTGGTQVFINASGKLGTITSSRRFKEEIKAMDEASQLILALRPVTFRYKSEIDPAGTRQFGLVAEEVEKVNRDLVVRDKEGKPYTVRYDAVNAMLLNEFLKEHKKTEKLEATVASLNRERAGSANPEGERTG